MTKADLINQIVAQTGIEKLPATYQTDPSDNHAVVAVAMGWHHFIPFTVISLYRGQKTLHQCISYPKLAP